MSVHRPERMNAQVVHLESGRWTKKALRDHLTRGHSVTDHRQTYSYDHLHVLHRVAHGKRGRSR